MRTFKVVTLGEAGSGKTVFMAAMFRRLGFDQQKLAHATYHLTAEQAHRNRLLKLWTAIASSVAPWPESTPLKDFPVLNFTLHAKDAIGDAQPVCRIQYIDYAGERLTQADESSGTSGRIQRDFEQHIEEADALLALLDGQQLAEFMGETASGSRNLRYEMMPTLSTVLSASSRCVVHIVITKWDLLERRNITLGVLLDELLKNDDFKAVVAARAGRRETGIRIIPVSSVGRHFVEVDEAGVIRKLPNARPSPQNTDIPIVALLPDFHAQLIEETVNQQQGRMRRRLQWLLERTPVPTERLERFIHDAFPGKGTAETVTRAGVSALVRWRSRNSNDDAGADGQSRRSARRWSRRQKRAVTELEHACDRMYVGIHTRLELFEREYPDSVITGDLLDSEAVG